ncbi:hypothetical protein [Pseudoxanthomonas sp.]|uniref:hypothetical protein n=1 Tax=Pseudoxanthomonas sp. TaxID=1871049 RepID=UPI002620375E|nr:hypothetical protein [Pseudoxanthomonas sp.]WDS36971.1 MAG: hypothetical protein O8I58_03415 [Pseudoxanthomonas sp.]
MTVWVLSCADADLDVSTQTCASPIYTPQVVALPTMTIADAQAIGQAIALLWAVAFVFRQIRKFINQAN